MKFLRTLYALKGLERPFLGLPVNPSYLLMIELVFWSGFQKGVRFPWRSYARSDYTPPQGFIFEVPLRAL